jgi:hypothetical protein
VLALTAVLMSVLTVVLIKKLFRVCQNLQNFLGAQVTTVTTLGARRSFPALMTFQSPDVLQSPDLLRPGTAGIPVEGVA